MRLGWLGAASLAALGCAPAPLDLGRNDDAGADVSLAPAAGRIALGRRTTMVIAGDGSVWAWGEDGNGQLAIPPRLATESCDLPPGPTDCFVRPARVPALSGVSQIELGLDHGCALRGGRVLCWGLNLFGAVGGGMAWDDPGPTPIDVGIDDAVAIATGDHASCAVHADGTVSCWGLALGGMFGVPDASLGSCTVAAPWVARHELTLTAGAVLPCALAPIIVPGLTDVVGVAMGRAHLCALRGDGQIICMGSAERGQLGDGSSTGVMRTPVLAAGDGVGLAAGSVHTCARRDADLLCWGADGLGQAGVLPAPASCGLEPCVPTATVLAPIGAGELLAVAAGDQHTCVVVGTDAHCFGNADGDAAGMRDEGCAGGPCRTVLAGPVVGGVSPAIDGGHDHTCAIALDGAVLCWGSGHAGELGAGVMVMSATPIRVELTDLSLIHI